MTVKLLALRRARACTSCTSTIAVGSRAWWDPDRAGHVCTRCSPEPDLARPRIVVPDVPAAPVVPAAALVPVATVVPVAAALPQTLRRRLDEVANENCVVLRGGTVPGTDTGVDHLVVAASGVWLIAEHRDAGRVEQRDVGAHVKYDWRLFVGGIDRTKILAAVDWQANAIVRAVRDREVGVLGIQRIVCLGQADWDPHGRPFPLDGVWVMRPVDVVDAVTRPGPLARPRIDSAASELARRLGMR